MNNIAIIGANSFLSQSLLKLFPENFNVTQVYNNNNDRLDMSCDFLKIDEFFSDKLDVDCIYFIESYIYFY